MREGLGRHMYEVVGTPEIDRFVEVGSEEGKSDYGWGYMTSKQGGGLVLASGGCGCSVVWVGWIYCAHPTVCHTGQHTDGGVVGGGVRTYLKVGGGNQAGWAMLGVRNIAGLGDLKCRMGGEVKGVVERCRKNAVLVLEDADGAMKTSLFESGIAGEQGAEGQIEARIDCLTFWI